MAGEPELQDAAAVRDETLDEVSAAAIEVASATETHRLAVEAAQAAMGALATARARLDAAVAAAATVPDKV